MQEGFNLGFKEGATAGLAYGQVRGAACSVAIFAGQVPGSSRWKESIVETLKTMEQLAAPVDAVRAARVEFERGMAAEANGGEPATPLRHAEEEEGKEEGGADEYGGARGVGGSRSGGGDAGDAGGEINDDDDDDAGVGLPPGKRKKTKKNKGAETVDSSGGSAGRGGDGTFAGRMQAAKRELKSAGFELHDFKLT